jgi:predicted ArsR family transcriptional regulator
VDRPNLDAQLDRAASLGDPVRRSLYRFVVASPEAVSRDEAAARLGLEHHVAKFHLDRLVRDGLLVFEYRRPAGRGGPGAGRPAKRYRRADAPLDVTLPERRYQLAGELLVDAVAVAERDERPIIETVRDVAAAAGRAAGSEARKTLGGRPAASEVRLTAMELLTEHGYGPCIEGNDVALANCPFHALAHRDPDLVCGMNLAFLEGVIGGLGVATLRARLEPSEDRCCVRLERSRARHTTV